MTTYDITVRPGQVWGDKNDMRELVVQGVDKNYVYCLDDTGRRTRILLHRMTMPNYYLKKESPARYVDVPSETGSCKCGKRHYAAVHLSDGCRICPRDRCKEFRPDIIYHVWTGDELSPAHCPCEDFRWATREAGKPYYCKHLKRVLFDQEAS